MFQIKKDMMEENEMMNEKEDLFSKAIRAGKRTYFFDVKTTKGDEKYLTITESKRRFDNEQNRFFYEKHKIFLYMTTLILLGTMTISRMRVVTMRLRV